jgi:hypothetical protein
MVGIVGRDGSLMPVSGQHGIEDVSSLHLPAAKTLSSI